MVRIPRHAPRILILSLLVGGMPGCAASVRPPALAGSQVMPRAELRARPPDVRRYLARRAEGAVVLDGSLDDAAWQQAPWTEDFTDIEGSIRPRPRLRTRVRMLYDDTCWYIGAELEEPDLWATITTRDAVIFHDNDFEVFIDADADTHRYVELEVNALGTPWDLLLTKPYRDGGQPHDEWNITGLRVAVALHGTLNDPRDRDRGWSVEIAIPWSAFGDSGRIPVPPVEGAQWRVNFSRVEWDLLPATAGYAKVLDPATGKPRPEHNWVWSPQGAVNMHIPEMWGVVQFGGDRLADHRADDEARWALRRVYYAERSYHAVHGRYSDSLADLGLAELRGRVAITTDTGGWRATDANARWMIFTDGKIQLVPPPPD